MSNSQWHYDQSMAAKAEAQQRAAFGDDMRNRIACPVIACSWGAETRGSMDAHIAAQHPEMTATLGGQVAVGMFAQTRAPGKMFSRETVCAIIRGQMAITHDSHLRDLLTIFENLE